MFALAAFAQASAIEVTFKQPARRSNRADEGQRKGPSGFIRTMRRAFGNAADERTTPWLPRLINYPY